MSQRAPTDPIDFRIVPLGPEHVPDAAALVAERVAGLREQVPELPDAWALPERLEATIAALSARGDALVALDAEGLVGFQGAVLIDGHGGRWAYTADIARAARGPRARVVLETLYARLAERWVRDACIEHVVTVLADDTTALEAFGHLGFGTTTVDLVRDLSPVDGASELPDVAASLSDESDADPGPGIVTVRPAGPRDADTIARLDDGLRRHLAASPVFLVLGAPTSPELHRRRLADPETATFLAEADGVALAFLRIGPSATDVAAVVRDPGTASITGAFTIADRRGEGVATALLAAAVAWASEAGYVRCAVDHESANLEAARFWRRHFTPVAYSLTRRLAPRLAR